MAIRVVVRFADAIYLHSLAFSASVSRQLAAPELLLASHDVQDEYAALFFVMAVENPTRGLNDLAIPPTAQLLRL